MAIAHRVAAAVVATAITAGLLALFLQRASRERIPQGTVVTLRLVAAPTAPPTPIATPSPTRSDRSARRRDALAAAPTHAPTHASAFAAPAMAASAPPPDDTASAPPLRLDERTIRRAIAAARASSPLGVSLPDRTPAEARFGDDVARAAKPDCLAPNPGGSLLSIPFIAAAALAGHCK